MLSFREERYGKITTITGPVLSGKTTHLERLLHSAYGSIWKKGKRTENSIVLAKHPLDDVKSKGSIAGYDALQTEDPGEIAKLIQPNTEAVVISGINFFEDSDKERPKIIELLKALVASNRRVYAVGHNLDWNGEPFNFMPKIMALSDDFLITKAPCMVPGCSRDATRSQKVGSKGERRCIHHHFFDGRPDHKHFLIDQTGGLDLFVGSMFASKTTTWLWKMKELEAKGIDYEVFKWNLDTRYDDKMKIFKNWDTGTIGLNNRAKKLEAITVENMSKLLEYIDGRTPNRNLNDELRQKRISHIFIDEGQFIDGIYDGIKNRVYQGYRFYVTGLLRDFKMEPFRKALPGGNPKNDVEPSVEEIPNLMAIADNISVMQGYCKVCGRNATDSQRLVKKNGVVRPANYSDPIVMVDGVNSYEARCKDCMEIPGMPDLKYDFSMYEPVRSNPKK